jgi:Domain of unknown function (DUF4281)
MSPDSVFAAGSTLALVSWAALIVLPRWSVLLQGLRLGVIGGLSLVYAGVISAVFFTIEGGGFNSIAEVRALFASDWALTAGWLHYLAFDLFVGLWIAAEADKAGVSRLLQAPILVMTFMFGPFGLLLWLGVAFSLRGRIHRGVTL